MNLLTAINAIILFFSPINAVEADIQPAGFRIQVYPYGGYYYSYPPCPQGYYSYRGRCYLGRPGYYYYGPRYNYGYPYYGYGRRGKRHHGGHNKKHHGGSHRGGNHRR